MSGLAFLAAVLVGVAPTPAPAVAPPPPPAAAQPAPTPAPPTPPSAADGPPASNAQAGVGESQIRSNYRAAESTRGPLDGRWRLSLAGGGAVIYLFQFSDSGGAPDPRATTPMAPQVEGAWQDLRRPDALSASGIFETVRRDGNRLVVVFHEGDPTSDQTLTLDPDGAAWTGDLAVGGVHTRVTMTRE